MAAFPALPVWTDAYLADCSHLTDAEHGRYFLMLQHMWRMSNRRFPNDDAWLARKFNRTVEDVQNQLRPLIAEFFQTDGNWLFHKRLEREWVRLSEMSKKQSDRSKSRWNKEKPASRGNAKSGIATTTSTTLEEETTLTPTVETQITVPPTGGTAAPPEAAKQALWREMKAQIGGNNPGSLVGKWVKLHGLPAVTDAHFAAMGNPPADYVEWMTKRLQANGKPYAARQPRGGKSYHDLVTESLTDDDESGSEAVHGMPGEASILRPGRADDDAGGYGGPRPYLRAIAGGL
jgi:uncharacterized protein YdaU (DUF1376 family)